MPRQAEQRPLVIRRYRDIDLANGMSVVGGVYGQIRVVARYRRQSRHKDFPLDAPLIDRLAWQHGQIERMRLFAAGKRQDANTLSEDIDIYLGSLNGARQDRAAQWLAYWSEWFGYVKRADLTLGQCQAFFQHVTPKSKSTATFSASSQNKLRTYLINVYRFHDGRRHECPVQDIAVFPEEPQIAREIGVDEIQQILTAMDDTSNRARLGVLFVTGCRPAELTTLREELFHLEEAVPYVTILAKKDGKTRMVPLPPVGVAYARDFLRHQAWRVSHNLFRDMRRAAIRAGLVVFTGDTHPGGRRKVRITPYALRHAYAMNLRRAGAGLDDIADALGHKSLQTTRRYAQAIPERQVVVAAKMWERAGMA